MYSMSTAAPPEIKRANTVRDEGGVIWGKTIARLKKTKALL